VSRDETWPDGWTAVGSGFDGGQYAEYYTTDVWMSDGDLVDMIQWYPVNNGPYLSPTCACVVPYDPGKNVVTGYDSGTAEVRAFLQRSRGNGLPDGSARAFAAVLAVPKPSPAATTVTIVEFYNAALDHCFTQRAVDEVADLDNGVHRLGAIPVNRLRLYPVARRDRMRPCRAYASRLSASTRTSIRRVPTNVATTEQFRQFPWRQLDLARKLAARGERVFQMDHPIPLARARPAACAVYQCSITAWTQRAIRPWGVRDQMSEGWHLPKIQVRCRRALRIAVTHRTRMASGTSCNQLPS
jgi:hypothetical protein